MATTQKLIPEIAALCVLCSVLSLLVASPALANPLSSKATANNPVNRAAFNRKFVTQESAKWRDPFRGKKLEVQRNNSGKPENNHNFEESRHNSQAQRATEKRQTWPQQIRQQETRQNEHRRQSAYGERKINDAPQHERRDHKNPSGRSSKSKEYKDKPPRRHDTNKPEEPRRGTPTQNKHKDRNDDSRSPQHGPQHSAQHSKERAFVKHDPQHTPGHRPNYRLYKRHKHIYYRTPWYHTRYFAPIHHHYHPIGYHVHMPPQSFVRIVVGGYPYFYYGGVYYRSFNSGYVVVSAPVGAFIQTLPVGFIAFSLGLSTYYFVNDTYYVWDEPRQSYLVVEKPEGAENAMAETTAGRLFIYPNEGQTEEQQAKDRYDCHVWAVTESRVDPTLDDETYSNEQILKYQRAMTACLEGRGYTVK
ncbi:MAG TPA: DUF6515 family protein [Gammaproteobacteria bacterium]